MSNHRDRGAIATGLLVVGLVACGAAVLPQAALGAERFALAKELVVHVTAALACVVCGRDLLDRRLAPPLLAILALAAISYAVRGGNAGEAVRSAGLLASTMLLLLAARTAGPHLAAGVAIAVTAIAIASLLEAHGVYALSPLPPGCVIGNRNAVAHLLAIALPLFFTLRRTWLVALALALVTDALVGTRCRGALVALAAAGVLAAVLARPDRRAVALLLAIAAGAAAALVIPDRLAWNTPYRDTLARLVEHDQGSGRGRLVQYRATLAMIAAHPGLGVGPGGWSVRYPDFAPAGDTSVQPRALFPVNRLPSSDWLGLAAALGLPALALLALFAARYAQLAYRRRAIAALATLAIVAVLGALDSVLGRAAPAMTAALALGALLPGEPARPARWLAALPLLAAAFAARLTVAGVAYGDGRGVEAAARLAPRSLYFSTYLAHRLLRRGACDRGRALAADILTDFPHLVALRELARACQPTHHDPGDHHAYDVQAVRHHPSR